VPLALLGVATVPGVEASIGVNAGPGESSDSGGNIGMKSCGVLPMMQQQTLNTRDAADSRIYAVTWLSELFNCYKVTGILPESQLTISKNMQIC
jgi:hypothetical protein